MAKNEQLKEIVAMIKYHERINQGEIATRLGVTVQYFSDVINGRCPFNDELRAKIYEVFSYTKQEESVITPIKSYTEGRPYYDVDFIGGFDLVMNEQSSTPSYLINFPPYNKDGVIWCNITGHSMEPEISHGDMIAIKEVVDWQSYMSYGEVYAIVTKNDMRTVKIVRKGSDDEHLRLVPINERDYDEQTIEKGMIERVFSVLACMKKV